MAGEPVDYEAVLRDLEAKRAVIDAMIANTRLLLGSGVPSATGTAAQANGVPHVDPLNIPDDAFFGLSIGEAAKKYLAMVRRKQSIKEIADALERGGLPHTSKNFLETVRTMVARYAKTDAEMVKVGRADWGLAGWYGSRRPRPEPATKPKRTKKAGTAKTPPKPKAAAAPEPSPLAEAQTVAMMAAAVLEERGAPMKQTDIQRHIKERFHRDVNARSIGARLDEQIKKGKTFVKPEPGVYALR